MKNAKYNYFMKLNYDFYQLVHYESKKPHNPQLPIHISFNILELVCIANWKTFRKFLDNSVLLILSNEKFIIFIVLPGSSHALFQIDLKT